MVRRVDSAPQFCPPFFEVGKVNRRLVIFYNSGPEIAYTPPEHIRSKVLRENLSTLRDAFMEVGDRSIGAIIEYESSIMALIRKKR